MSNYLVFIILIIFFLLFFCLFYSICNKISNDRVQRNLNNYDFNIMIEDNNNNNLNIDTNTNYQSINPANRLVVEESSDPDKECIICFEPMGEIECKLECNHSYHYNCIKEWVEKKNTCPECRRLVDPTISVI